VNFENFAEMQKIRKKGGYIHQQILDENKKSYALDLIK
jgi:hypothetical protein